MLRAPIINKSAAPSAPAAPATMTSPAAADAVAGNIDAGPAGAPVAEEAFLDLYRVELSKPIQSHKGQMRTVVIREPNAGDYIEIGRFPFDIRGEGEDRRANIDFTLAGKWVARLTDLDDILIKQLASRDFLALVGRINTILTQAGADVGN